MDAAGLAALEPLRAAAVDVVLLFDFDGTLAPIVDDPAAARPGPGIIEALEALVPAYRSVGVVSGRPVSFLAEHLPDGLTLSGLYGLESQVGGVRSRHPEAARWEEAVADAAAQAAEACAPGAPLAGAVVEPKGLSLTIHTRQRPDLAAGVLALARHLADRTGLELRSAKASVELHPPLPLDKGTALEALVGDATGVLFAGDDVGDLPAFAALDRLAGAGTITVAVVVGGPELPEELAERPGIHLAGHDDVADLLVALRP